MYYIYMLINPITGLPFYVGVGKEGRQRNCPREQDHINEAIKFSTRDYPKTVNRHKLNTILHILEQGKQVIISFGNRYELEKDVFAEEVRLIAHYGRRDLNTGILTNMTDGGEGAVNQSAETRNKRSDTMKGRPSPFAGVKLGPYSEERKISQKENMRLTKEQQTADEKALHYKNRSDATKGKTPWNAGIVMTEEQRKNMGAPKGRVPWNKGLTKDDPRVALNAAATSKSRLGQPAFNKGIPTGKKGMSYEELHGPEKAAELKEKRRLQKLAYWESKKA